MNAGSKIQVVKLDSTASLKRNTGNDFPKRKQNHQRRWNNKCQSNIDDILKEFPILSIDDIHQALNYVIGDIFKGVSYWKHDGITPLTQIKGYSEILVGKTKFENMSDKNTEPRRRQ